MNSNNYVMIRGNLGRDPEKREAGSGYVANTAIAVNRNVRQEDGSFERVLVGFFQIEAWGPRADSLMRLNKGDHVQVVGTLKSRTVEKDDGTKTTYVSILVDDLAVPLFTPKNGQSENKTKQQNEDEIPF